MGVDGVRQVPGVRWVVVEILYLVSLAVIIAVAAVVHASPHNTHGLAEFCSTTGEFRHEGTLGEALDVACLTVQAETTVFVVRKPEQTMAVDE